MSEILNRMLSPLYRRIKQLFTRGVLRLVDSDTLMQTLQVELLKGEVLGGIEHAEPYGYTSHPFAGAEVFTASVGGRRAHTIALMVSDRRYRKTGLAEGEVALYTREGDYIHFKNGRIVELVASESLTITSKTVTVNGNLLVTGNVNDGSGSMQDIRTTHGSHYHTGDSGGDTSTPVAGGGA